MPRSNQHVNKVIAKLDYLGQLTSRSMFGGYGICLNNVMFSLVTGDKFYLRANGEIEQQFVSYGMEQLVYMNRGQPILMRYYYVDPYLWQNEPVLKKLINISLSAAIRDKQNKEQDRKSRLRELPNITLSIERLLWRAKILNQETLFELGPIKSYKMMKQINHNLAVDILFALAGAVEGCHVSQLTESFKRDLLDALNLESDTN